MRYATPGDPEAFNKRPVFESTTPAEAVAAAIEAHMKAYGFKDVLIEVRPSCHIKLRPACTGASWAIRKLCEASDIDQAKLMSASLADKPEAHPYLHHQGKKA